MSKAIVGASLLAGAIGVTAILTGGFSLAGILAMTNVEMNILGAAVVSGAGMLAGAMADALTSNRGMNITTRQPASPRQIVYGTQRVGGVIVYRSTTGSKHDQYNFVIVLANHVCWGIEALYLDGRRVYFNTSSGGNSTRNGINFGGSADGNSYGGPDGVQYNFGGLVYAEARYGDQAPGDVITGLTANDGNWAANSSGSPYLGGCTYIYLKVESNPSVFPGEPEVRVTLKGKPVLDPRTGVVAYSSNSALIAADWASDRTDGLGLAVNQDQLIAAANVCDEAVTLAAGGSESRYACHYHFDTATAPSDAYAAIQKSMGGRRSFVGGEEFIVPAYWQGPAFSFDEGSLTAPMQWDPTNSFKDNCNRVTGTYTAPNFPYNIAGDLYDSNGFALGVIQNNFQFGFQPTSFPQYQADQLHGYAADEYLNEDSGVTAAWTSGATFAAGDVVSYTRVIAGVPYASVWASLADGNIGNTPGPGSTHWVDAGVALPMEVSYSMVLSIAQAQRLAKIEMLRNRSWGGGTFEMGLAAFAMQDFDVMNFSFPLHGWTDKVLEITNVTFKVVTEDAQPGEIPTPPECRVSFDVHETAESIYEWDPVEELTIYDLPALPQQQSRVPAPPTSMALTSSAATALTQPDGTIVPRIKVSWDTPLDGFASQIQMQYEAVGAAGWSDGGLVDISLNIGFIGPVIAGQAYNVRIRSLRPNGAFSDWVEIDGFTAGLVLSSMSTGGLAPGSLIGEAFSDGTAGIICLPFTAVVGSVSVSVTPTPDVDTGLLQGTLYYVYYIDATFAGGAVTAIATTDPTDFRGKPGYYLIGSKVTPTTPTGGSGSVRYMPSVFSDLGTRTTRTPDYAFDGDTSSSAQIGATSKTIFGGGGLTSTSTTSGEGLIEGFPSAASGSTSTLTVVAAATGDIASAEITASWSGGSATILSASSGVTKTTYTATIPASVPFNTVVVDSAVSASGDGGTGDGTLATLDIYEVFIDT